MKERLKAARFKLILIGAIAAAAAVGGVSPSTPTGSACCCKH